MSHDQKDTSTVAPPYSQTNGIDHHPAVSKAHSPIALTNEGSPSTTQGEGKTKTNPFYLTLIVGNELLHNSMIDYGASTMVMPKKIAEILNIRYDPLSKGVMQLDGNKV